MARSCIIFEIERDVGRKLQFFHTPAFNTFVRGPHCNIAIRFGTEKLEWCGYVMIC